MLCRVENLEETSQSLRMYIKGNTLAYCSVLSFLHQMKEKKLFQNFAFLLSICIYAMNMYLCLYLLCIYIYIYISIYLSIYINTPTLRGRQSLCCIQGFLTWTQTLTDGSETLCYVRAKKITCKLSMQGFFPHFFLINTYMYKLYM